MYPPGPNTTAEASTKDRGTSEFKSPYAASGEKNDPSTDSSYQSPNPSAPLQPSSPHDPTIPDMEPPSYSSVVNRDSGDWRSWLDSYSIRNNLPSYPPASPHINGGKSTSDLNNQAPYPTSDSLTEGVLAMPKLTAVKIERPIGFTDVVTSEPKSANLGLPVGGHGSTMTEAAPDSMNSPSELISPTISAKSLGSSMKDRYDNPMNSSSKLIYSTTSGEHSKFIPRRQQEPDQRAQQEDTSFLDWCLICCECLQCWIEVAEAVSK